MLNVVKAQIESSHTFPVNKYQVISTNEIFEKI